MAAQPSSNRRRWPLLVAGLLLVCAAIAAIALAGGDDEVAATTTVPVRAFPGPGSAVASPETQISFRGVPHSELGSVRIEGSDSGGHPGRMREHRDGRGASFVPDEPFKPGEKVTVETGLSIPAAREGDFSFRVAKKPARDGFAAAPASELTKGDGEVQRFSSRPDLQPPGVRVTTKAPGTARGRVFLAPKGGQGQDGPMIVDDRGELVWFRPLTGTDQAADFRVQRYRGDPVLTWWQGRIGIGHGRGEGVILDRTYQEIARVRGGNGYTADLHEFAVTPQGTALLVMYNPVPQDLSSVGGAEDGIALEGIVQEVDIETGLVLFEWHSLDHVQLEESYYTAPREEKRPWDYFHVNSVSLDTDGNLLVSARHTFAVYKINRTTGEVMWRLNGKRSDFKMGEDAQFAWQHDARRAPNGAITLFDNADTRSAPKPAQDAATARESRALALRIDEAARTATVERAATHPRGLLADHQGNTQPLPNGNLFVGWGQQRWFSEFAADGTMVFDGRLAAGNDHYRAYRFRWSGRPQTGPRLFTTAGPDGTTDVSVSWNGATDVARWTVLAGPGAGRLRPVARAPRDGFETTISVRTREPLIAVRALDARSNILGTGAPIERPAG